MRGISYGQEIERIHEEHIKEVDTFTYLSLAMTPEKKFGLA